MKYDSHVPVAVFLGPSLARHKAEPLLAANYYPPAKMGDIYRLLASGVETIVIIDGVFHEATPVWQREIVAALDAGIRVYGASSMGALRAAELDQLGMIGHGTIYEWYRDGVIDGDDEVALMHADQELGYLQISEPMVNIRHNLNRAMQDGVLDGGQVASLVAFAKARYFGDRSYHGLLHGAAALALPDSVRLQLTDFLTENAVNLKREDAISVLRHCAAAATETTLHHATLPRPMVATVYEAFGALKRGLLAEDGTLVCAGDVIEKVRENRKFVQDIQQDCAAAFYLRMFAESEGFVLPEDAWQRFRSEWLEMRVKGDMASWLRNAGLTRVEFDRMLRERATRSLLGTVSPGAFGIDFADQLAAIEGLVKWYAVRGVALSGDAAIGVAGNRAVLSQRAIEACLVSAWARQQGISAPDHVAGEFIRAWEAREGVSSRADLLSQLNLSSAQYTTVWTEQATYQWMLDKGPVYFGFGTYMFAQQLLEVLQLSGRAISLCDGLEQPVPQ